jgi:hypothetical protein
MSDYRHDPNRMPETAENDAPWLKWVYGGVAGALFLGLMLFAFHNDRTTTTASNQPSATAPATTTGSGASTTGSGNVNRPALPDRQNTRP